MPCCWAVAVSAGPGGRADSPKRIGCGAAAGGLLCCVETIDRGQADVEGCNVYTLLGVMSYLAICKPTAHDVLIQTRFCTWLGQHSSSCVVVMVQCLLLQLLFEAPKCCCCSGWIIALQQLSQLEQDKVVQGCQQRLARLS